MPSPGAGEVAGGTVESDADAGASAEGAAGAPPSAEGDGGEDAVLVQGSGTGGGGGDERDAALAAYHSLERYHAHGMRALRLLCCSGPSAHS